MPIRYTCLVASPAGLERDALISLLQNYDDHIKVLVADNWQDIDAVIKGNTGPITLWVIDESLAVCRDPVLWREIQKTSAILVLTHPKLTTTPCFFGGVSQVALGEDCGALYQAICVTLLGGIVMPEVRHFKGVYLSDAELRVLLRLRVYGERNTAIALNLGLSASTVKAHLDAARQKTGKTSRAALCAMSTAEVARYVKDESILSSDQSTPETDQQPVAETKR